jgi:hypothetical protein
MNNSRKTFRKSGGARAAGAVMLAVSLAAVADLPRPRSGAYSKAVTFTVIAHEGMERRGPVHTPPRAGGRVP